MPESALEKYPLMRNVILAFDDLAVAVYLAKVPCEVCGNCNDTVSPCALCSVTLSYWPASR
jgi:hypothetical protein